MSEVTTTDIVNNTIATTGANFGNPPGQEVPVPAPSTASNDSKMALFAKMEKINRAKEAEWKAKEGKYNEISEKLKNYSSLEEKFNKAKTNPWEFINEAGWDLEKLARHATENANDDELDPVSKRIKGSETTISELRAEIEQLKNGMKSREDQEKQYTQELFTREISSFIQGNKEKFEYLSIEEGNSDLIKELITNDLIQQQEAGISQDDMKVMPMEEAANLIEQKLDEYYSKRLTLNKVQSRFGRPSRTIGEDFSSGTESSPSSDAENHERAVNLVKSWARD